MKDLVKYEAHILPEHIKVKNSVREIYNANNSVKIKDISDKNVVVQQIHVFINSTILDKGINLDPTEINYVKTRVVDDIMRDFSHLSIKDIKLAFYYGVRGEFGDYFGINPITFYNWLKSYKLEMLPKVYLEVKPLLNIPVENSIKFNQKSLDFELASNLIRAYSEYLEKGKNNLFDTGNIHYNFLVRMRCIFLTRDEFIECKNIAIGQVKFRLSENNSLLRKQGKQYHLINLNDAFLQVENEHKNYKALIKSEFKRTILNKVFEQFKNQQVNLKEVFTKLINSYSYE